MRKKRFYRKVLKVLLYVPVHIILFFRKLILSRKQKYYDAKASNIIEGFTNLAIADPKIEMLAKLRARICGECPEAISIGIVNSVSLNNETKQINGMKCNKCGCLLNAKVRSTSDYCPLGKW